MLSPLSHCRDWRNPSLIAIEFIHFMFIERWPALAETTDSAISNNSITPGGFAVKLSCKKRIETVLFEPYTLQKIMTTFL
jgi:hypothetical protein